MSAVDRVLRAFADIDRVDRPEVWITLREPNDVLEEARQIDARVQRGETLPLAGLLVAVKDNVDVAGLPTTAGAPTFSRRPDTDATAVARLRSAGALVLGKTNLDQFATGLNGTRSPYGAVRNAWDPQRISGGSSSGSAVAVALGLVDAALGTDTAGSGRVPAALNGIWGVKPTKGRVPTTGVVPACRTLDCVTVFAQNRRLASFLVAIMTGPDGKDPRARPAAQTPQTHGRVGIPTAATLGELDDGWAAAFQRAVTRFEQAGYDIVELDIGPLLEAASLLYDGAFVAERYTAVGAEIESHPDQIGITLDATVARIILDGARPTAAELFRDIERLDLLRMAADALLAGIDCLVTPTTTGHPTIAEMHADPVGANSRLGRFTNFANLLDMASLAVPAGTIDGLPFGVMLTGPAWSDDTLAAIADTALETHVELFVAGAHLTGEPLNYQLTSLGARFQAATTTAPRYRLHALPTSPPKPALSVAEGGEAIEGEIWEVPSGQFGTFIALVPPPLAIGTVDLADGRAVKGFIGAAGAITDALDISASRSWRSWLREQAPLG